jgi:DmsE family decaheme c-type cytochrome
MTTTKPSLGALLWSALFSALVISAPIVVKAAEPAGPAASGYTEAGADTCLQCHADEGPTAVTAIFKTKHGNRGDSRTPFGKLQCETCHGPGAKHAEGGDTTLINSLKSSSPQPAAERNKVCLGCHSGNARTGWHGSMHDSNDVACGSCHKVHAQRDPVLVTVTQPDVCYKCHRQTRADFLKPSAHAVRFGKMTCSDCHNPHGSTATAMVNKPTVNQTCFTCHAEKRGPMLWEHAPVAEDCTLCHHPHGSVYQMRLKKNPPLLCQQCHSVSGHPSVARTGAALPGGSAGPSAFLLAGSCLNCHTQVHGSNHPSGAKLMR